MPCAIATAAIDTPSWVQAATASALNSSLWLHRRRPPSKAVGIVFTNPPRVKWIRDFYTSFRNSWADWTLTFLRRPHALGTRLHPRELRLPGRQLPRVCNPREYVWHSRDQENKRFNPELWSSYELSAPTLSIRFEEIC